MLLKWLLLSLSIIGSVCVHAQELSSNDSIRLDLKEIEEIKPRFPGCENLSLNQKALDKCAMNALYTYFFKHLVYPKTARRKGIRGNVVVSFVIEADGTVSSERISKEIGGGCGQAALNIVTKMKDDGILWIPGIQNNRKVRVQYHVPINFELDNQRKKKKKQ